MYNLTHFRHMIKNKLLLSDHKSFKEPLTVGIGPVRGFLSLIFFINTKTICKFNNTTYFAIELIYASVMFLVLPIVKKRLLGGKYIDGTFLDILAKLMGNDLS